MLELQQATHIGGDETAGYKVILDKEFTVKELIDEILLQNTWGTIYLDNGYKCEYKGKELLSTLSENDLSKKVIRVGASGGWGAMDYFIKESE